MKKTIIGAFLCLLLCPLLSTAAFAQELKLGGQVVGIKISTDGVFVAGLAEIETAQGKMSPAEEAGFCEGDLIIKIADRRIGSAADFLEAVASLKGEEAEVTVLRGEKSLKLKVKPVLSAENQWMLGMWLRDGISGIGTLTFCDPASGIYGALGHSVNDEESGRSMPIGRGSISEAQIVGVEQGKAGKPGELNGCADEAKILGSIEKNTELGIYGQSYAGIGGRLMETGEMSTGQASIVSTVGGGEAAEYSVNIDRVYKDGDCCRALLSVTDTELCSRTGGIVQGMSGSPIIQNGKIVGAVTHVFVNDPTKGYGISIYDMLEAAGMEEQAA